MRWRAPKLLVPLLAAGMLGACSSIVEGTSQKIAVETTPPGAACSLIREGKVIGSVAPTPGEVKIEKTKHDMVIECTLVAHHKGTYFNKSDVAGATVGNILLGGGIGWAIDSATGADNKYTTPVQITLVPLTAPPPAPTYSNPPPAQQQPATATPTS